MWIRNSYFVYNVLSTCLWKFALFYPLILPLCCSPIRFHKISRLALGQCSIADLQGTPTVLGKWCLNSLWKSSLRVNSKPMPGFTRSLLELLSLGWDVKRSSWPLMLHLKIPRRVLVSCWPVSYPNSSLSNCTILPSVPLTVSLECGVLTHLLP